MEEWISQVLKTTFPSPFTQVTIKSSLDRRPQPTSGTDRLSLNCSDFDILLQVSIIKHFMTSDKNVTTCDNVSSGHVSVHAAAADTTTYLLISVWAQPWVSAMELRTPGCLPIGDESPQEAMSHYLVF